MNADIGCIATGRPAPLTNDRKVWIPYFLLSENPAKYIPKTSTLRHPDLGVANGRLGGTVTMI